MEERKALPEIMKWGQLYTSYLQMEDGRKFKGQVGRTVAGRGLCDRKQLGDKVGPTQYDRMEEELYVRLKGLEFILETLGNPKGDKTLLDTVKCVYVCVHNQQKHIAKST